MELSIRRFDEPDEERSMALGRFDLVRLGGTTVARASYQPGWKWSEHVGPGARPERPVPVEHVGLVVSGRNRITMDDGTVIDVGPGDLFSIPAGHDSEVLGDEPYVSHPHHRWRRVRAVTPTRGAPAPRAVTRLGPSVAGELDGPRQGAPAPAPPPTTTGCHRS